LSKNNEKPLVSIITVCYNSEKYIRDAIESVLNQTYDNIEYIIVDGASTDNTLDIIKEYEPKFNGGMRWISEPDEGIYDAMNKGIDMANGEIIGIINSDDFYYKNTIEKIIRYHNRFPKYKVFYANLVILSEINGEELYIERGKIKKDKHLNFNHPTMFVDKGIYQKYGKFNTNFKLKADREFVLRLLNKGVEFKFIDAELSAFRLGGVSNKVLSLSKLFKLITRQKALLKLHKKNKLEIIIRIGKELIRLIRNFVFRKIFGDKFIKIRENYLKQKHNN